MPLTDIKTRNAKPSEVDSQIGNSNGLSLIIRKNEPKTWRYEFRIAGKKSKYRYSSYPEGSSDKPMQFLIYQQVRRIGGSQQKSPTQGLIR